MKLRTITKIVDGLRYDTSTAAEVASNAYWDGHNFERSGRNTFLCKTPKGRFFRVDQTCWQGERDALTPLSEDDAVTLYEALPEHEIEFERAFPRRTIEDA